MVIIYIMDEQARSSLSQVAADAGKAGVPPVIPVSALLEGRPYVRLEHRGEYYLLRVTRNGKLILTK